MSEPCRLKDLRKAKVPISGIGLQSHISIFYPPTTEIEKSIRDFARLGLHPLLWDSNLKPKPASEAVISAGAPKECLSSGESPGAPEDDGPVVLHGR